MVDDYITIGSAPIEEDCVQITRDRPYFEALKHECFCFKHLLERAFPEARLRVKTFHHDFGDYAEVVALFDERDEEDMARAFVVEAHTPEEWDEEAKQELLQSDAWVRYRQDYLRDTKGRSLRFSL